MASRGFWMVGCVAGREKPLEGFKMASRGFWMVLKGFIISSRIWELVPISNGFLVFASSKIQLLCICIRNKYPFGLRENL